MQWLIATIIVGLFVTLIALMRWFAGRAKSLPPITDDRPLTKRNPELGRVFPKRRGA